MDLKFEFKSSTLKCYIKSITAELPDGTDVEIAWREDTVTWSSDGETATQLCFGVRPAGSANSPDLGWDELTRARILNINWTRLLDSNQNGIEQRLDPSGCIYDLKACAVDKNRNLLIPIDVYSDKFPSQIPWHEIDRGARPMVRYFNNHGLPTRASCSGHPGTTRKRFWIEFSAIADKSDVDRFMRQHMAEKTDFISRGMFCDRFEKMANHSIITYMQYTAADTMDAALDLTDWIADDMSGKLGHSMRTISQDVRSKSAASLITANMDPETADALYRAVWKDRVKEDIISHLEDMDLDVNLTQDQINYAADRYVYGGKYDCSLSYWQNIENVIELAIQFG